MLRVSEPLPIVKFCSGVAERPSYLIHDGEHEGDSPRKIDYSPAERGCGCKLRLLTVREANDDAEMRTGRRLFKYDVPAVICPHCDGADLVHPRPEGYGAGP